MTPLQQALAASGTAQPAYDKPKGPKEYSQATKTAGVTSGVGTLAGLAGSGIGTPLSVAGMGMNFVNALQQGVGLGPAIMSTLSNTIAGGLVGMTDPAAPRQVTAAGIPMSDTTGSDRGLDPDSMAQIYGDVGVAGTSGFDHGANVEAQIAQSAANTAAREAAQQSMSMGNTGPTAGGFGGTGVGRQDVGMNQGGLVDLFRGYYE